MVIKLKIQMIGRITLTYDIIIFLNNLKTQISNTNISKTMVSKKK